MELLTQKVLVLNRSWLPIEETTVSTALCDMCRGAATGIDTEFMVAVPWAKWLALAVRDGDRSIRAIRGAIRVPTVICKSQYADMPKRSPKLGRRGIGERDRRVCQYTGVHAPDGTLDHVVPRSRGGRDTWENLVWSAKDVNHQKRDRTPEEAGLRLLRRPFKPERVPAWMQIKPVHPDWELFLKG